MGAFIYIPLGTINMRASRVGVAYNTEISIVIVWKKNVFNFSPPSICWCVVADLLFSSLNLVLLLSGLCVSDVSDSSVSEFSEDLPLSVSTLRGRSSLKKSSPGRGSAKISSMNFSLSEA